MSATKTDKKSRFDSLRIEERGLISALLYRPDLFLDPEGPFLNFERELYLYLKRQGFNTVVFYQTQKGFHTFSREDLERYLSDPNDSRPNSSSEVVSRREVRGSLTGRQMFQRKKDVSRDSHGSEVNVSNPAKNIHLDEFSKFWECNVTGDRFSNLKWILGSLQKLDHCAVVFITSTNEFDKNQTDLFSIKLADIENEAMMRGEMSSRLIFAINSSSYNNNLSLAFNDSLASDRSVFITNQAFRSRFIEIDGEGNTRLNSDTVCVLPPPSKSEIKDLLNLHIYSSDGKKTVDWVDLEDICEQVSFLGYSLESLEKDISRVKGYTIKDFNNLTDKNGKNRYRLHKRGDNQEQLDSLIGLKTVKDELANYKRVIEDYRATGRVASDRSFHLVFMGNPGTGKTTVARIVAGILKDLGILRKGHLVETDQSGLIGEYVGHSTAKTNRICDEALDGVLFIDEAYAISQNKEFGPEAISTLLKRMEDDRGRLVVIVAGYTKEMADFLKANPGLDSRFKSKIKFPDYTAEELEQIFKLRCKKVYTLNPDAEKILKALCKHITNHKPEHFANGRWVRKLLDCVEENYLRRGAVETNRTLSVDDFTPLPSDITDYIPTLEADSSVKHELTNEEKLKEMIGLDVVKDEIARIRDNVEFEKLYGDSASLRAARHFIFSGSPGTGKTTVARLLGGIFRDLGVLSEGHVVECRRADVVAKYVGHTAQKVREVFDKARGGVLFIDEVYALVQGEHDEFGKEALDEIVPLIENIRSDMVVVLAGYEELMGRFLANNPGLKSRFNDYVHFANYSRDEIEQILCQQLHKKGFNLSEDAMSALRDVLSRLYDPSNGELGNGRWARNLSEKIESMHKSNVVSDMRSGHRRTKEEAAIISSDDVLAAAQEMIRNKQC